MEVKSDGRKRLYKFRELDVNGEGFWNGTGYGKGCGYGAGGTKSSFIEFKRTELDCTGKGKGIGKGNIDGTGK
jgi:hypothetical protein